MFKPTISLFCQPPYLYFTSLFSSVVDPDPVGSVSFGWIRIVKWDKRSGPDQGREKKAKNIRIQYFISKNYQLY